MTATATPLLHWRHGQAFFHHCRVVHCVVSVGDETLHLHALEDAAALLEAPEFERRFTEDDMAPYGMELWPAARMLADAVVRGPRGAGRSALELGCGLGLVAMAATRCGWRVTATDNDVTALRFTAHNAAMNDVILADIRLLDWRDPPCDRQFERIFAADVLYQRADHARLLDALDLLLADAGVASFADPNRGIANGFIPAARARGFAVSEHRVQSRMPSAVDVTGRIIDLRRR